MGILMLLCVLYILWCVFFTHLAVIISHECINTCTYTLFLANHPPSCPLKASIVPSGSPPSTTTLQNEAETLSQGSFQSSTAPSPAALTMPTAEEKNIQQVEIKLTGILQISSCASPLRCVLLSVSLHFDVWAFTFICWRVKPRWFLTTPSLEAVAAPQNRSACKTATHSKHVKGHTRLQVFLAQRAWLKTCKLVRDVGFQICMSGSVSLQIPRWLSLFRWAWLFLSVPSYLLYSTDTAEVI